MIKTRRGKMAKKVLKKKAKKTKRISKTHADGDIDQS